VPATSIKAASREVAVKKLGHRLADDPDSVARLHIQAQTLAG